MTTYYHFARIDDDGVPRLTHGDNRQIVVGETLAVAGPVEICEHGLHASRHVLDALRYAPPRTVLCLVELGGEVIHGDDKSAATERRCVAMLTEAETDALLRAFARWCALSVAHLWQTPMPDVVRQYLETGDESLRAAVSARRIAAAWAAAEAARAASKAAEAAAWAAAEAASAKAAEAAAWAAAEAARAAWAAVRAAAANAAAWATENGAAWATEVAALDIQRRRFDEMALAAFAKQAEAANAEVQP